MTFEQEARLTPSIVEHEPVALTDHPAELPHLDRADHADPSDPESRETSAMSPAEMSSQEPPRTDAAVSEDAASSDDVLLGSESLVLDESRRTIKRYSNRKLYDTRQSRYVTLLQIAEMVRAGEDVQIIDNATKEDKTDVTLALIISEELKAKPRAIPLATLKALIRHRGGKLLTQLRESPIGRLMPREDGTAESSIPAEVVSSDAPVMAEDANVSKEQQGGALRRTLEQCQHTIDERIRAVVPHFATAQEATLQQLQGELREISRRLDELEKRVGPPRE
ncbi:MAG TPA: polyhydroxyalkanoate synthesis regulator DNA-binding domain-containing protein [Polyangiaceae bacterium]|nr:polyhydroxyalkanoate synthesis regulator DNA-binding domain-containing protein [Polyangiaceae bacterium]